MKRKPKSFSKKKVEPMPLGNMNRTHATWKQVGRWLSTQPTELKSRYPLFQGFLKVCSQYSSFLLTYLLDIKHMRLNIFVWALNRMGAK
jgi:hypothetical protein